MTARTLHPLRLAVALAALTASPSASPAASGDRAAASARARAAAALAAPVSPAEVAALAAPEPASTPADYRARKVTLHVLGVQQPGTPGAFATVADVATWETRDVRVGDAIGRNLVVRAIAADGVVTAEGAREVRLEVGRDVAVRVVEHAFDAAATPRGAHDLDVDPAVLARLRGAHGTGATGEVVVIDQPAVKLTAVDPRGVLAHLGLRQGDLLWRFDGQPVGPADLDRIATAVATPGSGVHALDVTRNGAAFTVSYYPR
ncbi:conserved hypothetical protein [Anaeromyxobacter dehalogenans 2CP-1]|uniref:PDZ domain-containing protein n=1 Tax=Anaeromyxobacter dehalogenans (strain ATCC BAA-258 / DSM 21875 / 2CP-1) TaxID=455488 RepID=B8J8D5_ANAD2|nr:hypothetical protein [Anaeromyxobacter dehalogenans]ACL65434.1 conserved hypothetical protein [Anaeromyxobacter dehalogenans 2CP-1]